MTDRALSSALDLSLCLLLISAAVLIVTTAPESRQTPDTSPAATLGVLSGITATGADVHASTPLERLTAGVLARARDNPRRAERLIGPVDAVLNRTTGDRQVIVRWRPVPELGIGGQVVVGADPPPGAAVDTVRTVVPIAGSTAPDSLNQAAREGFRSLAELTAERIQTRLRRSCQSLGDVRRGRCPPSGKSTPAVEQLSEDIEAHLRDRYDDPRQARANLALARVTVVVRTWST